jgi:hypothetical protein
MMNKRFVEKGFTYSAQHNKFIEKAGKSIGEAEKLRGALSLGNNFFTHDNISMKKGIKGIRASELNTKEVYQNDFIPFSIYKSK